MHTSLMLVALMGPGELPETQTARSLKWQDGYDTARQMGRQQNKPLAVVIGNGPTGWKKVAEQGNLSAKAKQLLAENTHARGTRRSAPLPPDRGSPAVPTSDRLASNHWTVSYSPAVSIAPAVIASSSSSAFPLLIFKPSAIESTD